MSFLPLQHIRWGWWAAAGLSISGATIYVLNNTKPFIDPVDVIEIVLATQERCYGTQLTTGRWEIVTNTYPTITNAIVTTETNWSLGLYENRVFVKGFLVFDQKLADEGLYYLRGNEQGEVSYEGTFHLGRYVWTNSTTTNNWWWAKRDIVVITNTEVVPGFTEILTNWVDESFEVSMPAYTETLVTNYYSTNLYPGVYYIVNQYGTGGMPTNAYLTNTWVNQVQYYTNLVTNMIGYYTEKTLAYVDGTLMLLIPYYIDEDLIVEGATGAIATLTVTGLFSKLGIGDGTNFTYAFGETNTITNYPVYYVVDGSTLNAVSTTDIIRSNYQGFCYIDRFHQWTTNLLFTTNNYTSSVPQIGVNFISEKTQASNFNCWIRSSNVYNEYWRSLTPVYANVDFTNSQVVIQTNPPSFLSSNTKLRYSKVLEERYKVLNALSCRVVVPNKCDLAGRWAGDEESALHDWAGSTNITMRNYLSGVDSYGAADSYSFTNDVYANDGFPYYKKLHYYSSGFLFGSGTGTNPVNQFDSFLNASRVVFGTVLNSNLQASCDVYVKKILMWDGDGWSTTQNYDEQGTGISEPDGWSLLESFSTKSGDLLKSTNYWGHDILTNNPPSWCDTPTTNDVTYLYEGGRIWGTAKGFSFNAAAVIKFQFNYATNRYW